MKKNTLGFITIIFLLILTSAFSLNLFLQQRQSHDKVDIHKFPMIVGDWKGKEITLTQREYDILETRNLIFREYADPRGEKLWLFIVYSETNRSVFHPPEVCLIGSGTCIAGKTVEKNVNKLILEKDGRKELALYSYKASNLCTDSYYLQQAYFAFNQLLGRRVRGATVRVSMALAGNEEAVLQKLKTFLNESLRIIDKLS